MTNSNSNANFCKPFRELVKSELNEIYYVRLGPKTYIVNAKKKIGELFYWSEVLVLDPRSNEARAITQEELAVKWLKPNIKAVVNYAKASEPPSMKVANMHNKARREAREKYSFSWKG